MLQDNQINVPINKDEDAKKKDREREGDRADDRLKINATADGSEQGQAAAGTPFPLLLLSCSLTPGQLLSVAWRLQRRPVVGGVKYGKRQR